MSELRWVVLVDEHGDEHHAELPAVPHYPPFVIWGDGLYQRVEGGRYVRQPYYVLTDTRAE